MSFLLDFVFKTSKIFFILLVIALSSSLHAQWWVSGGNLIWPYGNVDIVKGKLDVGGIVTLDSNLTVSDDLTSNGNNVTLGDADGGQLKVNDALNTSGIYLGSHKVELNSVSGLLYLEGQLVRTYYYPAAYGTVSGDLAIWGISGSLMYLTLDGNLDITINSLADGQEIFLAVTNSGSYSITSWSFPGLTLKWKGGSAPVLTANKTDIFKFIRIGSLCYGYADQNF